MKSGDSMKKKLLFYIGIPSLIIVILAGLLSGPVYSAYFSEKSMRGLKSGSIDFGGKTKEEMQNITAADALKHPNWDMGQKITIDSATLMNKGLEVIEAVHLFSVSADNIEVLVHRQSILHSAVELEDGAVIGQLGTPDMAIPIQFALTYPNRMPSPAPKLSLTDIGSLTFQKPDTETFRVQELHLPVYHALCLMLEEHFFG